MAHLKTRETKNNSLPRKTWKVELTQCLYEKGYGREDVLNLFRFIDWLMRLPEPMEKIFWKEMEHYEEERKMPYITSVEKIGIQKGIAQGIQQGLQQGMQQGMQLGMQQGMQQGMQEGMQRSLEETIRKMLRKGMTPGRIAELLEMDIRKVESCLKRE